MQLLLRSKFLYRSLSSFVKILYNWRSPIHFLGCRIRDRSAPVQRNVCSARVNCFITLQSICKFFSKIILTFTKEGTSKNQYFIRNFEKNLQEFFSEPDFICSRTFFPSTQVKVALLVLYCRARAGRYTQQYYRGMKIS